MKIRGAKHGDMENELSEWLCRARVNNIVVDACTAKEKADKIILKIDTEFKCSKEWLQHFKE
jgi:hypothetical protein